jgi:hypothetical protein
VRLKCILFKCIFFSICFVNEFTPLLRFIRKSIDIVLLFSYAYAYQCYCLNNDQFDNDMQPRCKTLCDSQNGVVCGGNQHMSVYRITNGMNIFSLFGCLYSFKENYGTLLHENRRGTPNFITCN